MKGMMQTCMKQCRWCPLIPVVLGILLFFVGYFLTAETVKILWLAFSCLPIIMGLSALIAMNVMFRKRGEV